MHVDEHVKNEHLKKALVRPHLTAPQPLPYHHDPQPPSSHTLAPRARPPFLAVAHVWQYNQTLIMSATFSAKKQIDNAMNDSKVAKVQQARQAYLCPLLAASLLLVRQTLGPVSHG